MLSESILCLEQKKMQRMNNHGFLFFINISLKINVMRVFLKNMAEFIRYFIFRKIFVKCTYLFYTLLACMLKCFILFCSTDDWGCIKLNIDRLGYKSRR